MMRFRSSRRWLRPWFAPAALAAVAVLGWSAVAGASSLGARAAAPAAADAAAVEAPPGGTVRSLAADPFHAGRVLLGTATSVLFVSRDGGVHWRFLSRVAAHDDWVVSSLVPDPRKEGRWYASLWSWASRNGGVAVSRDGGAHWRLLWSGHAVRALAIAPSDARELVAATLDGVFRSRDAGASWERISPRGNPELQNIESVAISPVDPQEIYVGTWHLPWKTVDGGHDWWQIPNGIIDDSDVFSIAVDRQHPSTVYLSACSGIYRSDNSGMQFRKIQGIPYSARRTLALVQDPADPATILAGTTQGLWITHDSGASWSRITSARLEINTVVVLPGEGAPRPGAGAASSGAAGAASNAAHGARFPRILLGTNFAGVYVSNDGGASFERDNEGFSSRHVSAVVAAPGGHYVAVTGDQIWGGVFFHASDGSWRQLPQPDDGHDVYSLHWSRAGLLAATAQGVFRLPAGAQRWERPRAAPRDSVYQLNGPEPGSLVVLAASQSGLYRSRDGGASWTRVRHAPAPLYRVLALPPENGRAWLFAAGNGYVVRSADAGRSFLSGRLAVRGVIRQLARAQLDGHPLLFAATSRGLYRSSDLGASWSLSGHGLPAFGIRSVHVQPDGIYALSDRVGQIYRSRDGGVHWQPVALPPRQEMLARTGDGVLREWAAVSAVAPPAAPGAEAVLVSGR